MLTKAAQYYLEILLQFKRTVLFKYIKNIELIPVMVKLKFQQPVFLQCRVSIEANFHHRQNKKGNCEVYLFI